MSEPYFETWRDIALCREVSPELMYPEKGDSTKPGKRVCAACPVRTACLDYAMRHDERFGIWGGLSERERKALRRQRAGRLAPVVNLPVPSVPQQQPRRAA